MHPLGTIRVAACGLLALGCGGCFAPEPPALEGNAAARCVEPGDRALLADQVLQLINLERTEAGLGPVVVDEVLVSIADQYACRMIEDAFFSHHDPVNDYGPADRAVAGKYRFYAVGENLAAGQTSPAEVVRVWMESPAHRDVILDSRWQDIGVSVRYGGEHAVYWVLEFGEPVE